MTQEIDKLLQEIVTLGSEIARADSCLIYLFDKEKKTLVLRSSKNPHPNLMQKISMRVGEGITGWVAQTKKPLAVSSGAYQHPHFKLFRNLPEDKFEAFLSVPIMNQSGLVGVMNLQHQKAHQHSKTEVKILTALGKLVGAAVENVMLTQMLATRKLLDRAKGILMHTKKISEPQAYDLIKHQSMNTRKSIKDICEAIIVLDNLNSGI